MLVGWRFSNEALRFNFRNSLWRDCISQLTRRAAYTGFAKMDFQAHHIRKARYQFFCHCDI
jgi:hypothetical protein